MYPKKQPKSDREKFYGAFQKKVGCKPEQYLRRKLAGGMQEAELRRLYDMLAVEIAMKARCTAIRYDALHLEPAAETAAERHIRRAATHEVPICARCGGRMVLRTGQTGARKGKKFWGCSNYPACRYTKDFEERSGEISNSLSATTAPAISAGSASRAATRSRASWKPS